MSKARSPRDVCSTTIGTRGLIAARVYRSHPTASMWGERHGVAGGEVRESTAVAATETRYATCPLCEATCGLEFTVEGDRVTKIRGDEADVFSKGFICPKGASLADLDSDEDRVRTP